MNAAKMILVSTVVAAVFGLALSFGAAPAQAHCAGRHINNPSHCDGDDGGDGGAKSTTFEVKVTFDGLGPDDTMDGDLNTIGSDFDVPFMDGVDGVRAGIIEGDGFSMWSGDNENRQLWIDLGAIMDGPGVGEIAEEDCPFIDAHRVGENRCAAFGEGTFRAHTVRDGDMGGGDRLLTMKIDESGTVTPDRDGVIFGWRVDLNFLAKLNPKGKKSGRWSILFNADNSVSDFHTDFPDETRCTSDANTSLNIKRMDEDTWVIATDGPQPACLFARNDGITAKGIVDVDLSYTITCVDDLCPAP